MASGSNTTTSAKHPSASRPHPASPGWLERGARLPPSGRRIRARPSRGASPFLRCLLTSKRKRTQRPGPAGRRLDQAGHCLKGVGPSPSAATWLRRWPVNWRNGPAAGRTRARQAYRRQGTCSPSCRLGRPWRPWPAHGCAGRPALGVAPGSRRRAYRAGSTPAGWWRRT